MGISRISLGIKFLTREGKAITFLKREQDLSRAQNPLEVVRSLVIVPL
jgi:hypothetical protein